MKIYLTEHFVSNGVGRICKMAGQNIEAKSLEDAEKKALELKVTVVGEWRGDVEWDDADDFCDRWQKSSDEAWLKDQAGEEK